MADQPTHPTVPPVDPNLTQALAIPSGGTTAGHTFTTTPSSPRESVEPALLPPGYELLGVLGRGGMGIVYHARQVAVNRPVALKMVLSGEHASDAERARFHSEAEAVAALQHPHVVAVYEVGEHAGRPFFSMEFCPAGSLASRLSGNPLSARTAAELVEKLARAVAEAHAVGLVHRDIKPANVLLTADGTPKVSDFGLAKRVGSDDGMTATGAVLGTPSYMPPEQAFGEAKRVGPAADVYSLGALLYELLTGRPPFKGVTAAETLHLVRTQEPISPRSLSWSVPRDLETVCLKCLEKNPARRYPTARELADDLTAWLAGRPVAARPAGLAERGWKWVRRNKAAAAVMAALVVGGIAAGWQWWRAEKALARVSEEQERTAIALNEKSAALEAAETARNRAETERDSAEHISAFLREGLLGQASVYNQGPIGEPDLKVRTALDRASRRIEGRFAGRPLVEAAIRMTIGNAYRDLGLLDEAAPHLEAALQLREEHLGPNHLDTLGAASALGWLREGQARFPEAEQLYKRVVAGYFAAQGPDSRLAWVTTGRIATLYLSWSRYAEALAVATEAADRLRQLYGPDDLDVINSMTSIAQAHFFMGRYAESEQILLGTLEARIRSHGEENPRTLVTLNDLAVLRSSQGRYAEAETLQTKTLAIQRRLFGDDHQHTLTSLYGLAEIHQNQGKFDEAEREFTEVLERRTKNPGPDHPLTLVTAHALGQLLELRRKFDRAETVLADALERRQRVLGPDAPDTLSTAGALGSVYFAKGQTAKARALLEDAYTKLRQVKGDETQITSGVASRLASLYRQSGELAEAEALYKRVLEFENRVQGPDHLQTLKTMNNLGAIYFQRGEYDRLIPLLTEILERSKRSLGETHPERLVWMFNLGSIQRYLGNLAEAERLMTEVVALQSKSQGEKAPRTLEMTSILADLKAQHGKRAEGIALMRTVADDQRQVSGPHDLSLANTLTTLGRILNEDRRFAEAEPVLRECLTIREKQMANDWRRFQAMSMLGESLLGQGKLVDARPLLTGGYEGLAAREARVFASQRNEILQQAASRLVKLAEAENKPDEAARWRNEASKYPAVAPPPREVKRP